MVVQLFKGTTRIIRLLFQRNGLKISLWLTGLVGVSMASLAAYINIYSGQKEIVEFGLTMQNPAMVAMLGKTYEIELFNLGTIFASELLLFSAIAVSVMNILLITSSTRMDEEEGRLELIRALPVGRLSYLSAAAILMAIVNTLVFMLLSAGLELVDHEVFHLESSLLYSAALASTGLFFAGVATVAAQVAQTTRGAIGISFGTLITAYIIRAIGDVSNELLSLFSPLGWTVRTSVFVDNEWWPVIALICGAAILLIGAFYLDHKRDINAALLPDRKGKAHASTFLKNQLGLTWRLEKGTIISWAIGIFLMSIAYGAILGDLEAYFSDFELIQGILSGSPTASMAEQFITLLIGIVSVFAVIPGISILLKLKKEERQGRTDNFYSRAVSRNKVLGSRYAIAVFTGIVMQLLIGIGLYTSASQVMEKSIDLETMLTASLVYIPAIWVVLGLTTLLVGAFPKGVSLVWIYVLFTFLVLYLGNLLEFPAWLNSLSAFYHVPQFPNEELAWLPLSMLSVVGIVLSVVGFIGYNKRDI